MATAHSDRRQNGREVVARACDGKALGLRWRMSTSTARLTSRSTRVPALVVAHELGDRHDD